ncbi:MAG: TIGR02922 family protein [Sneathiella sp.]|nr:TIGR02922 family protein [Sneathiella sp.]
MQNSLTLVTIIYYHEKSLELLNEVRSFPITTQGRVVIPEVFKKDKSIVAVCEGKIKILNKLGDRILLDSEVA